MVAFRLVQRMIGSFRVKGAVECGFSRYIDRVGTRVRDRRKEAIMANTTLIAMGMKR